MKVKRYFAANMRSALEMVKQEQGPDVLILSNRKVDGGVELVTADELSEAEAARLAERSQARRRPELAADGGERVPAAAADDLLQAPAPAPVSAPAARRAAPPPAEQDYLWTDAGTVQQMRDELASLKGLLEAQLSGLAWSDFGNRHPLRARLLRVLTQVGFSPGLARSLVAEVPDELDYRAGWHRALALLVTRLNVAHDPILQAGGRAALLGPTGVGKTTLVCKLAARFALTHGPDAVAIVSMDDRRLGAHQQMKAFGRLIGSTVYAIRGFDELAELRDEFDQRRLVLIDTPGSAPDDARYRELVLGLDGLNAGIDLYNVISATTDYLATTRVLRASAELAVDACILTKLDEAATLGPTLSAIVESGLPLAYTSAGQRVPDDLETVAARSLIERTVELAKAAPQRGDAAVFEQAFTA